MEKRIFLYGVPSKIIDEKNKPLKIKYNQSGRNSGNLFIGASLIRHIPAPWAERTIGSSIDIGALHENCDMIIIPASNFFKEGPDFSNAIQFLEKTKLPIITVGLGAQANSFNEKINITKENLLFFELLADRCETIGVRGYFTAECMNNIGIKNIDVIGCPSYFYNATPNFKIKRKNEIDETKVAINFVRKKELSHLISLAIPNNTPIIFQNELFELRFDQDQGISRKELLEHPFFDTYRNLPDDNDVIFDYISKNMQIYFDINLWMNTLKKFDFVVGPRLHGNMIALQSGVPALWIQHDSRTTEISDFLNLPAIRVQDLNNFQSFKELYEIADYENFEDTYGALFTNYVSFLEKNGIPHTLPEPIPTELSPKYIHQEAESKYTIKKG